MSLKSIQAIVKELNGKLFALHLPEGVTWAEVYDFSYSILQDVVKQLAEAADKAKPQQVDEPAQSSSDSVTPEVVDPSH